MRWWIAGILSLWFAGVPRMWQRWRVWLGGGRRLVGRSALTRSVRPAAAGVCGVVRRAGGAGVVVAQKGGLDGVAVGAWMGVARVLAAGVSIAGLKLGRWEWLMSQDCGRLPGGVVVIGGARR